MNQTGGVVLADWIVLTLRWVFILVTSLWLAFGDQIALPALAWLIILTLVNILATVLIATDQATIRARFICTLADFIIAISLFYLSLGTGRELTWIGLLPLISGALYFRWIGAAAVLSLNLLLQGWLSYQVASLDQVLILVGVMAVVYLLVGSAMAFLSTRITRGVRWPSAARLSRRKPEASQPVGSSRGSSRTIFDLISALTGTLNYQKVLETSLDLSANALAELGAPTDSLVSAVMLFKGYDSKKPEMNVATARRLLSADKGLTLPGTRGVLRHVIEKGNSTFLRDPKNDPELGRIIALHECRSAFILPLRTGLDAYGVLLFAHPDPGFFTQERREVLEVVCNQSVVAIQNARLYQALEQEKNRMIEIQEDLRKKLARDLHDGPTQSISAIAMRVNFARRLMDRDAKSASDELFKIEELARRTTKEIRHMLFTLRPLVLESQGLVAALESMAEKMKETFSQEVTVQVDNRVVDALETGKQTVVFFIVEEAITNARKHAQASQIWVRLKMVREGLSLLEIEDDGLGFDTSIIDTSYESRGSLGMINLRERAELVNGILKVDSARGSGTRIQVLIPLTEAALDRLRRGG